MPPAPSCGCQKNLLEACHVATLWRPPTSSQPAQDGERAAWGSLMGTKETAKGDLSKVKSLQHVRILQRLSCAILKRTLPPNSQHADHPPHTHTTHPLFYMSVFLLLRRKDMGFFYPSPPPASILPAHPRFLDLSINCCLPCLGVSRKIAFNTIAPTVKGAPSGRSK